MSIKLSKNDIKASSGNSLIRKMAHDKSSRFNGNRIGNSTDGFKFRPDPAESGLKAIFD